MATKKSQWAGRTTIIVCGLLVLLMLYVLSAGPASGLVLKKRMSFDTFDRIYAPLLWLANRSETVRNIWNWYTGIWFHLGPDK